MSRGTDNSGGQGDRSGKRQQLHTPPKDGGKLIVLTAPLTEAIDHAGYFIQMALASLPVWRTWEQWEQYKDSLRGQHGCGEQQKPCGSTLARRCRPSTALTMSAL